MFDIPAELLEILECRRCHADVEPNETYGGFVCEACGLLYPVEDGIPNFLIDEARPLGDEDPGETA